MNEQTSHDSPTPVQELPDNLTLSVASENAPNEVICPACSHINPKWRSRCEECSSDLLTGNKPVENQKPKKWVVFAAIATAVLIFGGLGFFYVTSGVSIIISTEILNINELIPKNNINLNLENAELLLVPVSEVNITTSMIDGIDGTIFVSAGDPDDYHSIPLSSSINFKIKNIDPGNYVFVVGSFSVETENREQVGGIALGVEKDGLNTPFALRIKEEDDGNVIDLGSTILIYPWFP
jgi:hypothetical protein